MADRFYLVYLTSTVLGVFTVGIFADYATADDALARQLARQNPLEPSRFSDLSGTIIEVTPNEERMI